MYALKLTKEGLETITAQDGLEGIAQAKKAKPDLILLDVMLPKMDGFRVLEEMQKIKELAKTPIILLTNLGQDEDIKKGKEHGAVDYLVKASTTPAQIAAKVKEVLKIRS